MIFPACHVSFSVFFFTPQRQLATSCKHRTQSFIHQLQGNVLAATGACNKQTSWIFVWWICLDIVIKLGSSIEICILYMYYIYIYMCIFEVENIIILSHTIPELSSLATNSKQLSFRFLGILVGRGWNPDGSEWRDVVTYFAGGFGTQSIKQANMPFIAQFSGISAYLL